MLATAALVLLPARNDDFLPPQADPAREGAGAAAGAGAHRFLRRAQINPDVWAGNVEKAMGPMARPKYARHVHSGFCRCQEPVVVP